MEKEENRDLIHKNSFEDQLITFCEFNFGALSLFSSCILLDTYSFLGEILESVAYLYVLEQEGKGRVGKCKKTSRST